MSFLADAENDHESHRVLGQDIGLNLDQTEFHIKMKRISAPSTWEYDLLHKNFGGEWATIGNAKWSGKDVEDKKPICFPPLFGLLRFYNAWTQSWR